MTMRVRMVLMQMVALAVMGLASCGHYNCLSGANFGSSSCTVTGSGLGSGGALNAAAFDYYLNAGAVDAAFVDTSSNFSVIPNFVSPAVTATGAFGGMVVVQEQWLYLSYGTDIDAYSIDGTTGALTPLTGSPFTYSGTEPYGSTTDPGGNFLFVTGANDDQVLVFAINQTSGALTTVGSYPTTGISFAAYPATDGKGKFLYVTAGNLGGAVDVFSISPVGSATPGALTFVGTFSVNAAVLQGEPTGNFMLGVSGNGANNGSTPDNNIYVYTINQSSGALTLLDASPTTYTPATLVVHPSGLFVYTFNQTVSGTSPMEGFSFSPLTGALTELPTISPFTAITAPAGVFDQSGAYLFMRQGTSLVAASVDTATGALTTASGSPITNAGNPVTQSFASTDPN